MDVSVLRFRLKELIAEKQFRDKQRVTMGDVANATGIHRMTLSKIANHPGYNTSSDVIDKLCSYFAVRISDLIEHIPENGTQE